MSIFFHHNEATITVEGNTYPHRIFIKSLGARFDGANKSWLVPFSSENLAKIQDFCQSIGGGPSTPKVNRPTQPSRPATSAASKKPLGNLLADFADDNQKDTSSPDGTGQNGGGEGIKRDDSLTVSQLMELATTAIQNQFSKAVWVVGEIQNLHRASSATYLSLAEEVQSSYSSQNSMTVSATIWSSTGKRLAHKYGSEVFNSLLEEGLKVRFLCQVTLYKGRGSISLNVLDLDPNYTRGELALAREKLLRELRAKNLDKVNKGRYLSDFPFRVGLITAEGSRAKSDFLHQLSSGGFPGTVLYAPSAVQGESSPRQVTKSLAALIEKRVDLIVITRGGGSAADLRWFDSPEIAYAIAACPIPVIAAIGHHDDFCVTEEICFERRKTPTAAADFVVEQFSATLAKLDKAAMILKNLQDRSIDRAEEMLQTLTDRLSKHTNQSLMRQAGVLHDCWSSLRFNSARSAERGMRLLGQYEQQLILKFLNKRQKLQLQFKNLEGQLQNQIERSLKSGAEALNLLQEALRGQDPRPWLKKGWTQLTKHAKRVNLLEDVTVGESLDAQLMDGSLTLVVQEKKPRKL